MLLIFDWDGTLINSTGKIVYCMQLAAESMGMPTPAQSAVENIIGLGLPESIATLFPDIDQAAAAELSAAYGRIFVQEDQTPCEFFPGVMDTLCELRDQGHQLAVATGKSRRGLNRVLNNLNLENFFDSTRCADETKSKPHPIMLEQILKELTVPVESAVMVGDTEFDMAMARNAAMDRIAVTYGAHAPQRLAAFEPCLTLDEFTDLLKWYKLAEE